MKRRLTGIVVVGVLAALCSPAAHAQWKWHDKSGQLHVSDLPPPADVPDKDVLQRPSLATHVAAPAAAGSAASAAKPAIDPELQARMRLADDQRKAQQKQQEEKAAAARADNCARAQQYMRTIDSGVRMTRTNDKGESEFLDDKQRAAEAERTRAVIASDCR